MGYDIGDVVRVTATFTNSGGTAANPGTVVLTVIDPSSNAGTVAVTNSGTGVYYGDVTIDEAGHWYYRFVGTGSVTAADEGYFNVQGSRF